MSRKNGKKKHTLLKILGVILAIFIIILVILLTHTQIIVGAIQKIASGTVNTINTFEPLGEPMKGNKENGQYKGILYGTIELHKCEKEIDCPNCGGTGICGTCNGEKQIICIIRALIKKNNILILDEATSNIDLELEEKIFNIIYKYKKESTIISNNPIK